MSRLKELIERYCPDGVEYRRFDELGNIFRGKRFVKKDYVGSEGLPCIHYGEMYGSSVVSMGEVGRNAQLD